MTVTLVATAGSASANSFASEVEAIAYMANRLNVTGWVTVTGATCTDTEKQALIEASRELNQRTWKGSTVTSTQALLWPRQFVPNPDAPWVGAVYFDTSTVPQRIKDATCELALQFLKAGTTDVAAYDDVARLTAKKIDVLDYHYDVSRAPRGLQRYPRVWNLIAPLLEVSSSVSVRILRG